MPLWWQVQPMLKPSFNTLQAGIQITRNDYHWGPAIGQPAGPITFGFRQTMPTSQPTFTQLSAAQMAAVENALRIWADVANITFTEVNAGGYTDNATMLFGNYSSTTDGQGANGQFPGSTADNAAAGDVWINTANQSTTSLPLGSYDYTTILHEVGHTLGLEHPGAYNAGPGVTITYSDTMGLGNNVYLEDTRQYAVMSYFNASSTGANHIDPLTGQTVFASTPLLHDIAAIQILYGANMTTRTGDSVYGFNGNTGRTYDIASSTRQVVYAIWDAGGVDRLDFSGYSNNQRIDLHPGSFSDVGALTMNVAIADNVDIENASGGSGNDSITGNDGDNILNGLAGNDRLFGVGGSDTLFGNNGNDTLDGGFGFVDTLYGGTGDDNYVVNDLDQIIEFSNEGYDTVRSSIRWVLGANLEQLFLTGTAAVNGFGNDLDNVLHGNSARNYLQGFAGSDLLFGGAGDDYYELSDVNAPNVFSIPHFDSVFESPNEGIDTVSVSSETFDLFTTGYTLTANVEIGIISGAMNFNLAGNASDNTLTGNDAINTLTGNDGNDLLDGKGGLDALIGGAGNDIYYLSGTTNVNGSLQFDSVNETVGGGSDTVLVWSTAGRLTYVLDANVENATAQAGANFNLVGNELNNFLTGNSSANVLTGNGGRDTLSGGAGLDTLIGGEGNDTYVLGDVTNVLASLQFDTVTEADGGGKDSVFVASGVGRLTYVLDANVENATAINGADFNLVGNDLKNVLTGNSSANVLTGNGGRDTLSGGAGLDTLIGGMGKDTYILTDVTNVAGALEFDTVTEADGGGRDLVYVASDIGRLTYVLGATLENATALDGADFNLVGNGERNILTGNDSSNVLTGKNGNDVLIGGGGRDTLIGGGGSDRFDFNLLTDTGMTSASRDVIKTFVAGEDRIDLSSIDAITSGGGANDTFVFIGDGDFTDVGQVRAIQSGLNTLVFVNTSGGHAAEASIVLTHISAASMTDADFIL